MVADTGLDSGNGRGLAKGHFLIIEIYCADCSFQQHNLCRTFGSYFVQWEEAAIFYRFIEYRNVEICGAVLVSNLVLCTVPM